MIGTKIKIIQVRQAHCTHSQDLHTHETQSIPVERCRISRQLQRVNREKQKNDTSSEGKRKRLRGTEHNYKFISNCSVQRCRRRSSSHMFSESESESASIRKEEDPRWLCCTGLSVGFIGGCIRAEKVPPR